MWHCLELEVMPQFTNVLDVYVTYDNEEVKNRIIKSEINKNCFFHFLDEGSYKTKKDAFKLKSHWAARKTPFIAVYDGTTMIKGFYSESDKDVVNSLINYLNESQNKETK